MSRYAHVPTTSAIKPLYLAGESLLAIAKAHGCSYDSIFVRVVDQSWYQKTKRKQGIAKPILLKANGLQRQGINTPAVARMLNVDYQQLCYHLHKEGLFYGRNQRALDADQAYRTQCRDLTAWVQRNHRNHIKVVRKGHLDHKFPVALAEAAGLTVQEVSHPCNLQYLSAQANCRKHTTPSITVQELRRRIRVFVREHGDVYAGANHYACKGTYSLKRGRYANL